MRVQLIDTEMTYDGSQLHSHWIYDSTGQLGDSLVAFVGPCDVSLERMVDLEDVRHQRPITSQAMLHFIGEFFNIDLPQTILLQRLLVSLMQQRIDAPLQRTTNDLYEGEHKLTVSIATASQVSTLLHAGINISSKGTPVPTKGLEDYGIDPIEFAKGVLEDFKSEFESISRDISKVRPVL